MSPVLRDIKAVFDDYRNAYYYNPKGKTCDKNPFLSQDRWMYYYLFPEVIHLNMKTLSDYAPCAYCSEEQVLRIMAEHGLL